jgi:uncharacterized protein YjbI with pentapeptide repeats
MADPTHLALLAEGKESLSRWRETHPHEFLDFSDADLSGWDFTEFDLHRANFAGADLEDASLLWANLYRANFDGANLSGANLQGTNLHRASFEGATLDGVNLTYAILTNASLRNATVRGCQVYGISVWETDVEGATQERLDILYRGGSLPLPPHDTRITIDNLKVAQFANLLLHNPDIRHVMNTTTSKVVLILGRFTEGHREVLDSLREGLRRHEHIPIIFDFEQPERQMLLETVRTLAGLSRFVVADLTNLRMAAAEIQAVVEQFPSKPLQGLLRDGAPPYPPYEEMRGRFRSVLPLCRYTDKESLLADLKGLVLGPVNAWFGATGEKERLEQENERQRREIEELRRLVAELGG